MAELQRKDIMKMMETVGAGQQLIFKLHPTFSGNFVIIELNPKYPAKKEKKWTLRLGETLEQAKNNSSFFSTDKDKKAASWVAERAPELISQPAPLQKAV